MNSQNIHHHKVDSRSDSSLSINKRSYNESMNSSLKSLEEDYDDTEISDKQYNNKIVKRMKLDKENKLYKCELCNVSFTTIESFQYHNEQHQSKRSMWECSECKKLFSSKSNLKVHLRVHTRIKPYHCKSCSYSCMHHSSIKEHLAKIHPNIVHSSTNPGYAFNSGVVPDPEKFNSSEFNREAFIAEAKQSNEKLVAQISNIFLNNKNISVTSSLTTSPSSSTSSSLSSSTISNDAINSFTDYSNNTSPLSTPTTFLKDHLFNENHHSLLDEYNDFRTISNTSNTANNNNNLRSSTSANFSINSLISNSSICSKSSRTVTENYNNCIKSLFNTTDNNLQFNNQQYLANMAAPLTNNLMDLANILSYASQIQFFYSYFSQLRNNGENC